MTVQIGGLASGLDTTSIITELMAAARAPRTKMTLNQSAVQQQSGLLTALNTKLGVLKTATDALKSISTWGDTQTASTSDATKVTATRTGGAAPGGYDVTVSQLASAARKTYAFTPPADGSGLAILNADGTSRATVPLAAGASIDDAVTAINASATAGLYAVNVSGSLVFSSKSTGVASDFSVGGAGTQTGAVAGNDAMFTVNNQAFHEGTNTITDAVPGVTLGLLAKTSTDSVGVNVSPPGPDSTAVTTALQTFVKAYNDVVTTARADTSDTRVVGAAASTSNARKGTLFADSTLTGLLDSMRASIGQALGGTSLADIGISTGAANPNATAGDDSVAGLLTLDTNKLNTALQSNPTGVKALLQGSTGSGSTDGFGAIFANVVAPYSQTGGILDTRITSDTSKLSDIQAQLDTFDLRMTNLQSYYSAQFSALETAMSKSQTMQNQLSSILTARSSSSS